MAIRLLELVDNGQGGMHTAISQEEGSADATYRLLGKDDSTPPTVNEISEAFDLFTGGVTNLEPRTVSPGGTAGAGKVNRVLPPVHPFRPELSCAGVMDMVGVGEQKTGASVPVLGLTSVTTQFPSYPQWDFRVKFTKRPYFLLPDEKIGLHSDLKYYPPDGSAGVSIYYADEWRRFTSTTRTPSNDFANATSGMLNFRTQSGAPPIENSQYGNTVYMSLQNGVIELMWYAVPYRYMLDFDLGDGLYKSYLTRFVGTVNQSDWNGYSAGSLMYLGATPTSYIPASPKRQKLLKALAVGLDQSLLMNVKLRFLHTTRTGTDVPDYPSHALFGNRNNVPFGHNLFANFATRRFHYAVGDGSSDGLRNAAFQSFQFALFFTDPLLSQPAGPI